MINGNLPAPGTASPGNYLELNTTQLAHGTGGRTLHLTGPGAGYWSFTDGSMNVNFLSIESFNHVTAATKISYLRGIATITVVDGETGKVEYSVTAPSAGTVTTAFVDVDGVPALIVAPGPGMISTIRIYSGAPNSLGTYSGALLSSIPVYSSSFKGGVNMAVGDVNGDGVSDLIVAPASGMRNPQISVYNGLDLLTTQARLGKTFAAFKSGTYSGVTLAAGNFGLNSYDDIVAGEATTSPVVEIFDGKTDALLKSFNPFSLNFKGGVSVATGDYNGDGVPDLIVGAGTGNMSPLIEVYNGTTVLTQSTPNLLATLLAGPANSVSSPGISIQADPVNGGGAPGFVERDFIVGTTPTGTAYYFTLLATDEMWWNQAIAAQVTGTVSSLTFDSQENEIFLQNNGTLDRWQGGNTLTRLATNVVSYKVGSDNSIYYLLTTGILYRWRAGTVTKVAASVTSYAVDANATVYLLQSNETLSDWKGSSLIAIASTVTSFDATSAGIVYYLQAGGALKQWKSGVSIAVAGGVMSFKLAPDGAIFALQSGGNLQLWQNKTLTTSLANVKSFTIASNGMVYALLNTGVLEVWQGSVWTS